MSRPAPAPERADKWISRAVTATVAGLAGIAGAISYSHMRQLAAAHGDAGWHAPRLGTMINKDGFQYFLDCQLGELAVMVALLNTVVSHEILEDAVGVPGVAGNPDKIIHAASRMVRLYEDLILWAERVRGFAMPSEYREVAEALVQFADQPIDELRDFVHRFARQVDRIPAAVGQEEPIIIDETVTFTISDEATGEFGKKLTALFKAERK